VRLFWYLYFSSPLYISLNKKAKLNN